MRTVVINCPLLGGLVPFNLLSMIGKVFNNERTLHFWLGVRDGVLRTNNRRVRDEVDGVHRTNDH